jgi:hypothetical protein
MGCASRQRDPIVIAPITVSADIRVQVDSAAADARGVTTPLEMSTLSEVAAGCTAYFSQTGGWPNTKEHIRTALERSGAPVRTLSSIEMLSFRPEAGDLIVGVYSKQFARTLRLSPPSAKPPNKALEPTTTSVTSPAAQEPRQP